MEASNFVFAIYSNTVPLYTVITRCRASGEAGVLRGIRVTQFCARLSKENWVARIAPARLNPSVARPGHDGRWENRWNEAALCSEEPAFYSQSE